VAWGGAGDCRYFLDNERFVLSDTAPAPAKKLFVWDRWSDAVHVIGEYLPQVRRRAVCGCVVSRFLVATLAHCPRAPSSPACAVRWTSNRQSLSNAVGCKVAGC
jgi:hypothetical protein